MWWRWTLCRCLLRRMPVVACLVDVVKVSKKSGIARERGSSMPSPPAVRFIWQMRRAWWLGCAFLFLFLFSGPSQITGILEGILFVPAKRNSCNYVPVFLECVSQEFLSCRNLGHSCKNQAILTVLPYEGTPTNLAVATQQKAQDTDTR